MSDSSDSGQPTLPQAVVEVPPVSQPLLYQRTYNTVAKKYTSNWEIRQYRPATGALNTITFPLELGGVVTIYPNLINKHERDIVTNEILQYRYPEAQYDTDNDDTRSYQHQLSLFRQYHVQGGNEPRVNCLLHNKATDTPIGSLLSPQPGYRYGKNVTMKARSYENLPLTYEFTKVMELLYTVTHDDPNDEMKDDNDVGDVGTADVWNSYNTFETDTKEPIFNIGAHLLLYRDGHDSMGFHADNDQEESYILTTIMAQKHARDIIIKPKPCCTGTNDSDEHSVEIHYKLQLCEGDAYAMDGAFMLYFPVPISLVITDSLFSALRCVHHQQSNNRYNAEGLCARHTQEHTQHQGPRIYAAAATTTTAATTCRSKSKWRTRSTVQ